MWGRIIATFTSLPLGRTLLPTHSPFSLRSALILFHHFIFGLLLLLFHRTSIPVVFLTTPTILLSHAHTISTSFPELSSRFSHFCFPCNFFLFLSCQKSIVAFTFLPTRYLTRPCLFITRTGASLHRRGAQHGGIDHDSGIESTKTTLKDILFELQELQMALNSATQVRVNYCCSQLGYFNNCLYHSCLNLFILLYLHTRKKKAKRCDFCTHIYMKLFHQIYKL